MKDNCPKTKSGETGAVTALFIILGIFPGIFLGGEAGLIIANLLFDASANAEILRRLMAAAGMMLGITLGGAGFMAIDSIIERLIGMTKLSLRHRVNDRQDDGMPGCHSA